MLLFVSCRSTSELVTAHTDEFSLGVLTVGLTIGRLRLVKVAQLETQDPRVSLRNKPIPYQEQLEGNKQIPRHSQRQ